jgi:hypothetical protein
LWPAGRTPSPHPEVSPASTSGVPGQMGGWQQRPRPWRQRPEAPASTSTGRPVRPPMRSQPDRPRPADHGPDERDEEYEIGDVEHPDAPVTRVGLPLWARAQPGRYHELGRRVRAVPHARCYADGTGQILLHPTVAIRERRQRPMLRARRGHGRRGPTALQRGGDGHKLITGAINWGGAYFRISAAQTPERSHSLAAPVVTGG